MELQEIWFTTGKQHTETYCPVIPIVVVAAEKSPWTYTLCFVY